MSNIHLITVIIPVYNGEKYIKKCIENLLNQTFKNIEIIVVNDGSTDNSELIAKQYPVKIIKSNINQGLSIARNIGLYNAKGKYIHFMDVDDDISETYYELMYYAITKNSCDIACSGMVNEVRPKKSMRYKKECVYTILHNKLEATYVGKIGYVWRYLFDIEFLKEHELTFHENRLMEDLMFSITAIFHSKKLVVVPHATYYYRKNQNSIMNNSNKDHVLKRRQDRKFALVEMHNFSKKHNFKIPGVTTGKLKYIIKKWFNFLPI